MNVLLVAKEETTRLQLEELFASRRYEVTACGSSQEAHPQIEDCAFRYAVIDLDTDAETVEIVRQLRACGVMTYILVLPSAETPEALRPALEAGADDYLGKPVSLDALRLRLAIAERRLAGAKQIHELGRKVEDSEQRSFDAEQALRSREQYFRALLENSSDLVTILNADGQILYQTSSSLRLLGWDAEDQFGQTFFDYLHPDDRRPFTEAFQSAVDRGEAKDADHPDDPTSQEPVQFRYRSRTGEWRALEALFSNLLNDPVVAGMVLNSRDITEHRRVAAELQRERAFFRQLFRSSPSGIVILDPDDRVVDANDSFLDLFQYDLADLRRQRLAEIVVPEGQEGEAAEMARAVSQQQAVEREARRQRKDGTSFDVSIVSYPIVVEGRSIGAFGIYNDITERKNAERKLFQGAFYDALTKLPNRPMLRDRLQGALRRARRNPEYQFAVLFVDLDRFKEINDTLGHQAGDELLIEVASRLQSCVRPGDTTARLGGDEFTILLEDLRQTSDATLIAERILDQLHTPYKIAGQEISNSGSIGLAFSSPSYESADEILRDADVAMYRAKTGGKDRYEIFDTEMQRSATERLRLEGELRGAIDDGQLELFYQPVWSVATRRLVGFEALVRWRHPESGLIGPEIMLPVCEESGLVIPVGRWVLTTACRQLADWQQSHPDCDLVITVNLSAKELASPDLTTRLEKLCQDTGLKPTMLGLEIRHATLIKAAEGESLEDVLWQLGEQGFRLYIDDVSSDEALLSALHRLPIEALKLDRQLVAKLKPGSPTQTLVSAIQALGGSLGVHVVAKGIETEEQLETTTTLDLAFAQGHLLAEARPAEEAEKLLDETPEWPLPLARPFRTKVEPSGTVLPARAPRRPTPKG